VKADLAEKTNWSDSDEMALMFRNTYQPAFYKQLYGYVHANYRQHLALHDMRSLWRSPSLSRKKIKKTLSIVYYKMILVIQKKRLLKLEKISASSI
jgi:hypothetical protein